MAKEALREKMSFSCFNFGMKITRLKTPQKKHSLFMSHTKRRGLADLG
jgi:hypothetical protein